LVRVLDLLWEHTTQRIDRLGKATHRGGAASETLERILLDRAAESERRLIADLRDWEAYPPNACSCPRKKNDWDYRKYSRSCMRGDHQDEARVPGQGVD
jgi:hypothetical protein